MKKTLVIGYGNIYRRDDGVGAAVVNRLRQTQGRPALQEDQDGFDQLGEMVDSVLVHQLVPELAELLAGYDLVVFVDAHVTSVPEAIREEAVDAVYRPVSTSHQLHPGTLLALAREMTGRHPQGILLSLRGHDFDFGEGLSDQTEGNVGPAVQRILDLTAAAGC
jgi:hydrogenase maturation protease